MSLILPIVFCASLCLFILSSFYSKRREVHVLTGRVCVACGARFLWKVKDKNKPEVKVYKWTGKNDYVALCEPGYISFGGGYVSSRYFTMPLFRPSVHSTESTLHYLTLCSAILISNVITNSDGHYGLYLDDTLYDGSSAPCPTFGNEALCTGGEKGGAKAGKGGTVEFVCVGLEVWGVGGMGS